MTTSNDQFWLKKKCPLTGEDGAKLAALKSAVEAYLLNGALLKPEADLRQLTIYVLPGAKILIWTPVVLWLLRRWAKPSQKPKTAEALKSLFFFPPFKKLSLERQGHMLVTSPEQQKWVGQLLTAAAFCSLSPSLSFSPPLSCSCSVFLLAETRGSAAFPGTWGV